MLVLLEDILEVFTAGRQHQFVSCYLVIIISDYCDIMEVILIPQETEGVGNIRLEIIPFETKLLRHRCRNNLTTYTNSLNSQSIGISEHTKNKIIVFMSSMS